ncbi:MAG: hypothetical protein AB8F65_04310 [Woeseiaceae bacterium]
MKKQSPKSPFDASQIAQMANAKPKGKRPSYFSDAMAEHSFSITMSLVAELAVARERTDTLERLLVSKGIFTDDEVDTYTPDPDAGRARQQAHTEYIARILRSLQQEAEALAGNDPTMQDLVTKLGDADA